MDFGAIFLVFEFLVFLIVVPVAFLIIKKLTEETKISDTIIINRDGGKTEQKVLGNLISKKTGKNGRLIIEYLPRDSKTLKPITIIAETNKVVSYPKGVWSAEKNVIEILPNSAQDYFNNLLSEIEDKSMETHIIKAQREGINRQAKHLFEMGEGEISDTNLGLIKDFEGKLLKTHLKEESKRFPAYPQPEPYRQNL